MLTLKLQCKCEPMRFFGGFNKVYALFYYVDFTVCNESFYLNRHGNIYIKNY